MVTFPLLCSIHGCVKKQSTASETDSITVIFWNGNIIRSVTRPCSQTFTNAQAIQTDSIIKLKNGDFDKIKSALECAVPIKEEGICDSKMLVISDSIKICICGFNMAYNMKDERLSLDLPIIYLIKWKSGYYNYMTKDDLSYFYEIKKYGIPPDHKYVYSNLILKKKKFKKKPISKIIFIREQYDYDNK